MLTSNLRKIVFLGTFPPRECGLANFANDLVTALKQSVPKIKTQVVAVNRGDYAYEKPVVHVIEQDERSAYADLAQRLNDTDADAVMIEHEYGIYGGECGEYLLDFIHKLEIPYFVTCHTVLPDPNPKQRSVLSEVLAHATGIVTMSDRSAQLVVEQYGAIPEKIRKIHHGVPRVVIAGKDELKKKYSCQDRTVISTFGLLGPGKGLEYAIESMQYVVQEFPDVLYLVLGQTHPNIIKEQGEVYREKLVGMVARLGLEKNIRFINRYLATEEIIEYLGATDVYLTPYPGKNQAVSGTLAFALAYGKVIVTTPYQYAEEMVANGYGYLTPFNNSVEMANNISNVLRNPEEMLMVEKRNLLRGEDFMWDNVAKEYAGMISEKVTARGKSGWPRLLVNL